MIKTRVLNELTAEVSLREAEAYACTGGLEYGPGHCRHHEHMALRYAAFRRNHPNGLKASKGTEAKRPSAALFMNGPMARIAGMTERA